MTHKILGEYIVDSGLRVITTEVHDGSTLHFLDRPCNSFVLHDDGTFRSCLDPAGTRRCADCGGILNHVCIDPEEAYRR